MAYEGYGCPCGGPLLDGMIAMELARVDPSIANVLRLLLCRETLSPYRVCAAEPLAGAARANQNFG